MNDRYAKGRRNEWKSRDHLLKSYDFVVRSGGSLGKWDLVAFSEDRPLCLVQVKTNRKPPLLSEVDARAYGEGWLLLYHVWKDYAHGPEVYNARSGIRLDFPGKL